jgi:hypothetical protein
MWLIFLEALGALLLLLLIVWWTMFCGRRRGERDRGEALLPVAPERPGTSTDSARADGRPHPAPRDDD